MPDKLRRVSTPTRLTRAISVIAHVDHGKTTLSDRLLEYTGTVAPRDMVEQVLDQLDLERERGITIKAQAVRMLYKADDGQTYQINLIDTPGHVDFSYEVSRALAACDGAILVVDASQGIEAQTLANVHQALDHNLKIVPVVNKIDLPQADPELVREEIEKVIGLPAESVIFASARQGIGTKEILEAVVREVPPPTGDPTAPLRALIFDAKFDAYRGVVTYVRVLEGTLRKGVRAQMMQTGKSFEVDEVGIFRPERTQVDDLSAGEVGYLIANIRNVRDSRVGDTVTDAARPASAPLPGYRHVTPMVFAGLFPTDSDQYQQLKEALEKLQLNDAALVYEPETSAALGFGFRCGFLGLLHMEIVQERLEREFNLTLLGTAPTVEYRVRLRNGEDVPVDNPDHLPSPSEIESISEPIVLATIVVPSAYVGNMMQLSQERRGQYLNTVYEPGDRVVLTYRMPLAEIIHDYYDQLKSRSKGYASLDYELVGFEEANLVKLDVLVGGSPVDALSMIVDRSKAQQQGRRLAEKLKTLIPRQLFEVPIQAAIGGKIVARETVPAMRKDVTAKCYGGDVTRKRKLLEKQKEGKKRLKRVGNVEIPQEAFMAVLSLD
ncbi:MAG: elongation factor 4 [Chloroflexi bacterium 13_1_20CM_66_33]|nr:MAG: elongation factor 4 [Chloroflexi bacterium 13_1_20CM_66_33]TME74170.1 MAG: elongation factor 4 [Chloroflexota bacterium]TMG15242.1 MAG: elongation factor 4 [Chloroflexota bacterium]TMG19070.1 MAG: elongation factor 4 [Chloroflexota bacterium]TMG50845.1 MAG: elongation factor 4 [Chloroflexota bacterium]